MSSSWTAAFAAASQMEQIGLEENKNGIVLQKDGDCNTAAATDTCKGVVIMGKVVQVIPSEHVGERQNEEFGNQKRGNGEEREKHDEEPVLDGNKSKGKKKSQREKKKKRQRDAVMEEDSSNSKETKKSKQDQKTSEEAKIEENPVPIHDMETTVDVDGGKVGDEKRSSNKKKKKKKKKKTRKKKQESKGDENPLDFTKHPPQQTPKNTVDTKNQDENEKTTGSIHEENPQNVADGGEAEVGAQTNDIKANRKKRKKKRKRNQIENNDGANVNACGHANDMVTDKQEELSHAAQESSSSTGTEPTFPYPTDADDHCETPLVAYQHIAPLLDQFAQSIGKTRSNLAIYDPYYCDGSAVRHLASLGFDKVYNEKVDCYRAWKREEEGDEDDKTGSLPPFDVLITNPPYSGDHLEQLVSFLSSFPTRYSSPRAWFVLAPTWLHKREMYTNSFEPKLQGKRVMGGRSVNPFYIVPDKRYVYAPPRGFRPHVKSETHKKSSPFVSMWFVWGGSEQVTISMLNSCFGRSGGKGNMEGCQVARSRSALRDLRRKGKKV